MGRIRSVDTGPERVLRQALWNRGLRYRKNVADVPGKPDIAFPGQKLAVFLDGDFWHGYQWQQRGLTHLSDQFRDTPSRDYWLSKIRRNMARDCRVTDELLDAGWTVLRFWETRIAEDMDACLSEVLAAFDGPARPSAYSNLPQRTFAEFFAGIGLMRIGLERCGWSAAFANDIDEKKLEMYQANFEDARDRFVLEDVHALPGRDVPTVSLATASFPCNDLSLAGSWKGLGGKQSSAFWGFVRAIEEMGHRRPPLVLLENVTGFLRSKGGRDLRKALTALNRLGYAVDAFMLDALHFVPHSRPRLFVVGVLDEGDRVSEGPGLLGDQERVLRPPRLANFMLCNPDIRWRLRRLPNPPEPSARLNSVIEDLPEDSPHWWSRERAEYLLNQMSERHRAIAERMIAGDDWSYGTVFRRVRHGRSMAELRTDGIAGCLRTPRGGSGRQILFRGGKNGYAVRLLTSRECARLMGADDYKITVPLNQALFGFGDAVCVPAIAWIASCYLDPLVNELLRSRVLRRTDVAERT